MVFMVDKDPIKFSFVSFNLNDLIFFGNRNVLLFSSFLEKSLCLFFRLRCCPNSNNENCYITGVSVITAALQLFSLSLCLFVYLYIFFFICSDEMLRYTGSSYLFVFLSLCQSVSFFIWSYEM